MPDYYTPLFEGKYLDLPPRGCFTESADESFCLKYQSGEGFTSNSAGYQRLPVAWMPEVGCETAFFCQPYGPSLRDDSFNIVQFRLSEDDVELVGARGSDPGLDVHLTVYNGDTRLTFLTCNGEEFWVSADAFAAGD